MEEIWLSRLSFDYLMSLGEAFCEGCPWAKYHQGYFNSIIREVKCTRNSNHTRMKFITLMKTLEQADKIAGLERNIPVYINYYQ